MVGEMSFWYSWTLGMKKRCRYLILKKRLDFRVGSNWQIFWFMNLGVANLRFNYLRCFSINFENCCAHLAANFLYFPNIPNFLYLDGFEETYGQNTKNIGNQKNANLSKSWYLTFFDDEISKLFFHSYGPRIPKWNFAHHLWSKQAQNIRKTSQNTWFTDPCFKSLQTGHPVVLL